MEDTIHQLPRDTAFGPISISRWRGSERRRNGLSAVNPRRTGASASAPETRSVGIRLSVSEPIAIVDVETLRVEILPPPTSRVLVAIEPDGALGSRIASPRLDPVSISA